MDRYTKIKFLASGHFGKAYLYEGKEDKLQYVIKMINVADLPPNELADANREVRVLQVLHHPNIIEYIESFEDEGNLCIVTEFCEEGDLARKLDTVRRKGETVSEDQIWEWFIQICQALKYLHGSTVIHRDIKPSNMFVAKDGSLRLGDFGLSKIMANYGTYSQTRLGTLCYNAPELFNGDHFNDKCDIWSVGIVLYEMAALKHPFAGNTQGHTMNPIMSGNYPPLPATTSMQLRNMIGRLLNVEPWERPNIQQILDVKHLKDRAQPELRLKSSYGYSISNDGVMLDAKGNPFLFDLYPSKRDNQNRYESIASGTQLSYIERAIKCGYGVIVLNSTDVRPDIEGCKSPEDHGIYVWRNYIKKASAKQIAVKAHSDGGIVTLALFSEFETDFKHRVYAHAFTGVSCLFGKTTQQYIKKVTRNWVTSDKPLGTVISSDSCECVSAGTSEHEETPYYACDGVFQFIEKRFQDKSPGNL